MSVAILKYNAGNVRSVSIALSRLGVSHEVTDDPESIAGADRVILPGVGEASTAMRYLRERELDTLIAGLDQPVLGICLGLQLLCSWSEENDTRCIGVFPETVRLFTRARKVPHIGWNYVAPVATENGESQFGPLDDYFYFVHSYFVDVGPSALGVTDYDESFASVVRKDNFFATQFHPEKSADAGYRLLQAFLSQEIERPLHS